VSPNYGDRSTPTAVSKIHIRRRRPPAIEIQVPVVDGQSQSKKQNKFKTHFQQRQQQQQRALFRALANLLASPVDCKQE